MNYREWFEVRFLDRGEWHTATRVKTEREAVMFMDSQRSGSWRVVRVSEVIVASAFRGEA